MMERLRWVERLFRGSRPEPSAGNGPAPVSSAPADVVEQPVSSEHVFARAVADGQTRDAAGAFEKDSAEYRRQYWNRLATIDYQIAIAGKPGFSDAEFMDSGRTILDWFREFELCDDRSVVLDIGCGVGRLAYHVAPLVRFLHAIDVSDEMVERAGKNLRHRGNVEIRRTTGESLTYFSDASFDLVYSILVLQHMERANCQRLLAEIARVLRPGGKVLLQLPWTGSKYYTSAYDTEPKDNDLWYGRVYSEDELARMFTDNGLAPLTIRVVGEDLWGVAVRSPRS